MKHKLIVENFRKFLKESQDFDKTKTCLIKVDFGNKKAAILYNSNGIERMSASDIRKNEHFSTYELIGAITLHNTMTTSNEPCIPKTYEVTSIFVERITEVWAFKKS